MRNRDHRATDRSVTEGEHARGGIEYRKTGAGDEQMETEEMETENETETERETGAALNHGARTMPAPPEEVIHREK